MAQMEFKLTAPDENSVIQQVEFNYEELKKQIAERTEHYKSLVYSDDEITNAKEDRANLNKLSKALNDKRLSIKKQYLQPYEAFEKQIKELDGMIKTASGNIDGQVKAYEDNLREAKLKKVEAYFSEQLQNKKIDIIDLFQKVMNPKWGNASTSMTSIKKEIDGILDTISDELRTINNSKSKYAFEMREVYTSTLNLGLALQRELELQEAEARRLEFEANRVNKPVDAAQTEILAPEAPAEEATEITSDLDEIVTIAFRVTGTKKQLLALSQYMKQNGIRFEQA